MTGPFYFENYFLNNFHFFYSYCFVFYRGKVEKLDILIDDDGKL